MQQRNRQQGGLPAFGPKLVQERGHGAKDLAQSGALPDSPGRAAGARSHDDDSACFPDETTPRPWSPKPWQFAQILIGQRGRGHNPPLESREACLQGRDLRAKLVVADQKIEAFAFTQVRDLFYGERGAQQYGVRARAPTGQQGFNKDQTVSAQDAYPVMGPKAQHPGHLDCASFQLAEGGSSMRIDHGDRVGKPSCVPRDQCEQGAAAAKQCPHKTQDGRKGMST